MCACPVPRRTHDSRMEEEEDESMIEEEYVIRVKLLMNGNLDIVYFITVCTRQYTVSLERQMLRYMHEQLRILGLFCAYEVFISSTENAIALSAYNESDRRISAFNNGLFFNQALTENRVIRIDSPDFDWREHLPWFKH